MFNINNPETLKRIRIGSAILIAIIFVVTYIYIFNSEINYKTELQNMNSTLIKLSEENNTLKDENVSLEAEIESLKNENTSLKDELDKANNKKAEPSHKGPTDFKSYMDYTAITNKSSESYKIVTNGWTDEDGLRRFGECYCVALGSYYGEVGDIFLVETSNGNSFKVVKADEKSDKHTDSEHKYTLSNGCMLEFIVETNKLAPNIRSSGNINNLEKVSGTIINITSIEVYKDEEYTY